MNNLLSQINASLFVPAGLEIVNYFEEAESQEYGACRFEINGMKIISRNAKITPNKVGQFVTVWKRSEEGPIAPFDQTDSIDLVMVNVQKGKLLGQFVFPKSVLCDKGVFSTRNKEGKRGVRVYPPWDIPVSKQAINTQEWQLTHFLKRTATTDQIKNHYSTGQS